MNYFWKHKELPENGKITPPKPKRAGRHPKPKRDNMFKRIWSTVKGTTINKIAPFVLNSLDFDFDVDKPKGKDYVVASIFISFHGKKVYGRQKTIKI